MHTGKYILNLEAHHACLLADTATESVDRVKQLLTLYYCFHFYLFFLKERKENQISVFEMVLETDLCAL